MTVLHLRVDTIDEMAPDLKRQAAYLHCLSERLHHYFVKSSRRPWPRGNWGATNGRSMCKAPREPWARWDTGPAPASYFSTVLAFGCERSNQDVRNWVTDRYQQIIP